MNKVTTINLNGRAYQLEESGYAILREYLDKAEAKLHDNPDKTEIMADFEQAIADKCDQYLVGHKNVVSATEIEAIIAKMGPVDASGGATEGSENAKNTQAASASSAEKNAAAPKRLYRIPHGEWIAGVCNGLAAYFHIDVTLVRVLFVLLTVISHGFGVLLYIILIIVMPVARTDEEKAQAYGTAPFNAHDFIEQAKMRYAEFQKNHPKAPPQPTDPHDKESWRAWKQEMKNWKNELKQDMRRERREARHKQNRPWQNNSWQNDLTMNAGAGFFRFIMTLIIVALTLGWIGTIVSLSKNGTIFGYALVPAHPLWIAIAFVTALFYLIMLPFKLLRGNARPSRWGRYSFFNDLMQSIFFLFALYIAIVLGREFFPLVNAGWNAAVGYLQGIYR